MGGVCGGKRMGFRFPTFHFKLQKGPPEEGLGLRCRVWKTHVRSGSKTKRARLFFFSPVSVEGPVLFLALVSNSDFSVFPLFVKIVFFGGGREGGSAEGARARRVLRFVRDGTK